MTEKSGNQGYKKPTKRQIEALTKRQAKWKEAEKKAEDLRKLEDQAWRKYFKTAKERYDRAPKSHKGVWGDFFPEGLRDTEIQLVDSAGQKFDLRVGPVFGKGGIYKEPGLWIGVQRRYMSSSRNVELLISPEIWKKLNKEVLQRFKEYNPRGYGPSKVISAKPKRR